MVTSTFATPATATLATAAARALLDDFGCSFVRVWLHDGFDSAEPIVTLGGPPDGNRKLSAAAAARAIASGRRSLEPVTTECTSSPLEDGYRLCLPIHGVGSAFGCIECYSTTDVSFSLADRIEASLVKFAIAVEAATATDALERDSRGTILVIDEDSALRALLVGGLQKSGFTTLDAANGLVAFDVISRRLPDLVLMNFPLSGASNRETVELLRRRPDRMPVSIVMLVDANDTGARVAAMAAGANECISKPFDMRDLVTRVAHVLRWRELLSHVPKTDVLQRPKTTRVSRNESLALYESRHGNLAAALEIFVVEAQSCEASQRFASAARAYRGAALAAREMRDDDLANKFTRLTGKMYLTFAETTSSARSIESAYVAAAKCFLEAGNLQLASKSLVLADDFETMNEAAIAL